MQLLIYVPKSRCSGLGGREIIKHILFQNQILLMFFFILLLSFQVQGHIITACLTSVWNAILFWINNIISWYKIAILRLIELFQRGIRYLNKRNKKRLENMSMSSWLKLLTNTDYQLFCTENVKSIKYTFPVIDQNCIKKNCIKKLTNNGIFWTRLLFKKKSLFLDKNLLVPLFHIFNVITPYRDSFIVEKCINTNQNQMQFQSRFN